MDTTIKNDIGIAKPLPILANSATRMNKTTKNVIGVALIILAAIVFFHLSLRQANFPFTVDYRKALTSSSYVAQIVNSTDKVQSVKATFYSPTFNRTKVWTLIINAHHFREIGYLEGWAASSGDTVTLECNGVSKKFHIP
jgi:hypothetical protein